MALTIPEENGGTFERCPEGNHVAVCSALIDQGTQYNETYDKHQRKIWIEWEISGETQEDGSPFYIGKSYTFSMNEKAALRKDLESWRGVKFTPEDFGKFQLSNVLGVGCMLNVIHNENGGKTYANIASIARLPKGMGSPAAVKEPACLSLEPGEFDNSVFVTLSEKMQERIMASPEYQTLKGHKQTEVAPPPAEPAEDEIPF